MRPPSLKSVAKVLGVVVVVAMIRYFPQIQGGTPGGGQHRNNRRHHRGPHNPQIGGGILNLGNGGGQPAVPEPAGRGNVDDVIQNGAARDPSQRSKLSKVGSVNIQPQPGGNGELDQLVPPGFLPIAVEGSMSDDATTTVRFCKLDTDLYHRNPSETPMFKDLVRQSKCSGVNVVTKPLDQVARMKTVLSPDGFVFHQSRVGSTLAANLLGSDPQNLVFSESAPPASTVLHCTGCSPERQTYLLRVIVNAMGNSPQHTRLFFKLQSAQTPSVEVWTKAFPHTPWVYLFRDPVEIMVSHLGSDPSNARQPPCLRSKRRPPPEVASQLSGTVSRVGNAEYCAAHLNYLNANPLKLIQRPGTLGRAVHYSDMPAIFVDDVAPNHFHLEMTPAVKAGMLAQSGKYSKARKGEREWEPDSARKHEVANADIELWANKLMKPSYDLLINEATHPHNAPAHKSREMRQELSAAIHNLGGNGGGGPGGGVDPEANLVHSGPGLASIDLENFDLEPFLQDPFEETTKEYLPYPDLVPLTDLLKRWPPDIPVVPDIPGIHTGSLEVLDFTNMTERRRAAVLRWNEVPFLLNNVGMIDHVKELWTDEYLQTKFGDLPRKITTSDTNHFMYFNKKRVGNYKSKSDPKYKAPTGMVDLTFHEWLAHAKEAETAPVESPHFYMQLGSRPPNDFIAEDLPDFQPHKNFFIIDQKGNRGINCRFGAKSIIAEAHYDGGRNFIAMIRGAKRYVLLPPSECDNIYLYPKAHPEGRHAEADWSQLDLERYPKMAEAKATEVVLSAGQVLYVPSYWFHYIVSLGQSAQCNSRSGNAIRGRQIVKECGFY